MKSSKPTCCLLMRRVRLRLLLLGEHAHLAPLCVAPKQSRAGWRPTCFATAAAATAAAAELAAVAILAPCNMAD
eukprot:6275059-Prymnesium_polylepis.1